MKVLYIDTSNSGISGDMFLAALLDLVPNPDIILNELLDLKNYLSGVSELEISLKKVKRSNVFINQLDLKIKEKRNHRSSNILKEALLNFLAEKEFSDSAKEYAINVLNSLIQAESEVHDDLPENIHLHELSSVDTLIDILGVTKVLDILAIFTGNCQVKCSKLPLGGGKITTVHGRLPVPAPATSKILEKSNLIVHGGPIEAELVTPTGAALLSNLNPQVEPYEMDLKKLVYSTGQKEFKDFLNILRVFYGEIKDDELIHEDKIFQKYIEPITVLETDVDDVTGEILGNFVEKLTSANILDIQITSNISKKNRPSYTIKVLCLPEYKFNIIEKMIEELGTLGVRINTIQRFCVDRKIEYRKLEIHNKEFNLRYKISFIENKNKKIIANIKPEYEDLKVISQSLGISVKEVLFFANNQIKDIYLKNEKS